MTNDNQCYVYIITNTYNTVLYTGVTTDINRRAEEHHHKMCQKSFSARYEVKKLVYLFEAIDDHEAAMLREKTDQRLVSDGEKNPCDIQESKVERFI